MLDVILRLGLLKKDSEYTLDYDNTVIDCEKYDSKSTYLRTKGYQPGVCFINKLPIYIENRNGNSVAYYKIKDTIERGINLLESKRISINKFRSDSAACVREVFELLDKHPHIQYFIKFHKRRNIPMRISMVKDWEELPEFGIQIGCIRNKVYGKLRRFVITKKIDDPDPENFTGILTHNKTSTNKEVYYFYNKRGAIERNFDDLKNNFNWSRLPFSFLNENTVFLIISAIAYLIYQYIINAFSKKVDFVKKNFWLKNFIFHFITIGSEWIDQNILRLYTNKSYQKLMICSIL
jgi:transposase